MRSLFAVVAACGALAAIPANSAAAGVVIDVSKSRQIMNVSVDGKELYSWRVSTGKLHHGTPSGVFSRVVLEEMHHSSKYDNAPMPHSIFFTKYGHAIHGSNDTRHLGNAVSHGCVRLTREHASVLYNLVKSHGSHARIVISALSRVESIDLPGAG